MDLLEDPRYKDKPVYLFFEKYILDVIGYLSTEKREILENMNLQEIFKTYARSNWHEVVGEVLQLSSTIDIAILSHWYLYLENTDDADQLANAESFSKKFVDEYFSESSTLDLWTEESLVHAQRIIHENQLQKA